MNWLFDLLPLQRTEEENKIKLQLVWSRLHVFENTSCSQVGTTEGTKRIPEQSHSFALPMLEKTTASGRRPPFSGYRHGWCSLRWRRDSPEETRHQASPCLTGWVEHTYNSGSMEDHSWMVEMMSGVPAVVGISFSEGFVWDNASFTYTGPTLVGPNFHIKEAKNSRQTSV